MHERQELMDACMMQMYVHSAHAYVYAHVAVNNVAVQFLGSSSVALRKSYVAVSVYPTARVYSLATSRAPGLKFIKFDHVSIKLIKKAATASSFLSCLN